MGNFKSIEEVERMASIVSDMGKSKLIRKDGPYDMCAAAMENIDHEAYLKIISKRSGDILNKKVGGVYYGK